MKPNLLDFVKTKELLSHYALPLIQTGVFDNKEKALAFFARLTKPAVLKLDSPLIIHKIDKKAVKLDIQNQAEFNQAWQELDQIIQDYKLADAKILLQPMRKGIELVIGAERDKQFGPVVMFGIGGIFIELIQNVSFRIVPFDQKDARQMIKEIEGFSSLEKGFRGYPPVNIDQLADILLKTAQLIQENSFIQEIDFNPLIAGPQSLEIVDAKILVSASK